MKKTTILLSVLLLSLLPVRGDEGMWLLPLLEKMNSGKMTELGFEITPKQIYDLNNTSLKDAIVIFGGGCTGELVSNQGLLFTNHHCGFKFIQQLSTVEHDYLHNGFWSNSYEEELPCEGIAFTFVKEIKDVTDEINARVADGRLTEEAAFQRNALAEIAKELFEADNIEGKEHMYPQLLPYFEGNKYYLVYYKKYTDVRLVATPPNSIGKFGGETDNWMWPRHTGDFSVFRIYGDKDGNPAAYSKENVPLSTPKFLSISLAGFEPNDYAMIMGFPGSTSRYLTGDEVKQRMFHENEPRIAMRDVTLNIIREEMAKSEDIAIRYANKQARISNYWKNSIGMNKAIVDNKVLETKAEQEARFAKFAQEKNNADYAKVVGQIDAIIEKSNPILYQFTCYSEILRQGIEYNTPNVVLDSLKNAIQKKDKAGISKFTEQLKKQYDRIHNKNYDHEVDRKVAKVLLPLYAEMVEAENLPAFYATINGQFKGDYNAYVDHLYDKTIFANEANFNKFINKPSVKAIDADLMKQFVEAKFELGDKLMKARAESMVGMDLLHKTYVRGLCEMYAPDPKAPDANFTMRFTYGNVKPYDPKDGVHYKFYTTLKGVMEKEDPNNPEFVVPAKLKELYEAKDFGRYAMANGEMPACFLTTNDITGGNSGSPVINGKGELIGCAFDGNWESLSGDINFDNDKQRCIVVDIRYVLFILEKLGGCKHLVDEMTIVE